MSAELLPYVALVVGTGLLAGLLAGLLGIGGGLVFVPALLFAFHQQGVAPELAMHLAVGTSLAAIVLTSTSSIAAHARRGSVDWVVFRGLLPGLVLGGVIGALAASIVPGTALRQVFGAFLVLVAVQLIGRVHARPGGSVPDTGGTALAGATIGTVSAMLGIGGGTLTVPFLVWCKLPVLRAVGTAAAAGLPLALAGVAGFVVTGWSTTGLPPTASGFVDWATALPVGLIAMIAAPAGVRLAHRVPGDLLRRMFGFVMLVIAFRLLTS